jgi:rhamnose transport system permease protein
MAGTVLGVILLAAIGPALTFLGVSAYWERAIQGAIILIAVAVDGLRHPAVRRIGGIVRSRVGAV